MTTALAWVAMVTLVVTLASTLVTILWKLPQKQDLLRLTELILSWPVIAGGLAIEFGEEIRQLLKRNHGEGGRNQGNKFLDSPG